MQRKVEWLLPLAILQGAQRPVTVSELVIHIQETRKLLGQAPTDFHSVGQKLRPILYRLRKLGWVTRETISPNVEMDLRSSPWAISDLGAAELRKLLIEMGEVRRLAEL